MGPDPSPPAKPRSRSGWMTARKSHPLPAGGLDNEERTNFADAKEADTIRTFRKELSRSPRGCRKPNRRGPFPREKIAAQRKSFFT